MTEILLKRIYDIPAGSDGYRLFIDKLWPRGMTKEQISYDEWRKDVAPSAALRKWYHQDQLGNQHEFEQRYLLELSNNPGIKTLLETIRKYSVVTLLTAAKEPGSSYLIVLKKYLETFSREIQRENRVNLF